VIGLAGKISLKKNSRLRTYFDLLLPISNEALKLETAIQQTSQNLQRTSITFGNALARKK
jgi:hypothetical protein